MPQLLDVHDITEELVRSYGSDGTTLIIDPILGLVVHDEGGEDPNGTSAYGIARTHRLKGWAHIGHTWVIERNGALYKTLGIGVATLHQGYDYAAGDDLSQFPGRDGSYYNDRYWSVVLVGNCDLKPMTEAQQETLLNLCAALTRASLHGFEVVGLRELPGKTTKRPGQFVSMPYIRAESAKRAVHGAPGVSADAPGPNDDAFARQYTLWRDAYAALRTIADAQEKALEQAGRTVEQAVLTLAAVRSDIRAITGGK